MYSTFEFEDAIEVNKQEPRHFLIPASKEIAKLAIGNLVKLIFILKFKPEDGCRAERMWVEISEINGNSFKGILTNKPYYITELTTGSAVSFEKRHIAAIYYKQPSDIDEEKFAIITLRAMEMREVNWTLRDVPADELDSGWQLFYGDEDEKYLNDAANTRLMRLSEIMAFEPLLEIVFRSDWEAAEYNGEKNAFVKAEG
jgi:hypothetical protein